MYLSIMSDSNTLDRSTPVAPCSACSSVNFGTLRNVSLALWPAEGGYSEATDNLRFHVHICLTCGHTDMFASPPRAVCERMDVVLTTLETAPYR
jgi:hypothetical protein